MADAGGRIVDVGVNMGVGRLGNALGTRGAPLPDFFNPDSDHPFRDSQAGRMMRGDRRAWKSYARRGAGALIDRGLMATPLGLPNLGVKLISGLFGKNWSLGGLISNIGNNGPEPTGTVGGQPAQIGPEGTSANGVLIDPWTGQQLGAGPAMPSYSDYGPYSGGYQLPGDSGPQAGPSMPDFAGYGDVLAGNTDGNGGFIYDPAEGETGPERRRTLAESRREGPALYGVSNFMVGGAPVINGVRPAGYDPNQAVYHRDRDYG